MSSPSQPSRIISPLPDAGHDHDHCVAGALDAAQAACRESGERLTPLRRRILELVWASHGPVKAYELLDRLRQDLPRAQPVTVYRALDFLMAQGLVHRIESRNAFIGCGAPGSAHRGQFLICRGCSTAAEIADPDVARLLATQARELGFSQTEQTVEVHGLCPDCARRTPQ